MSESVTGYDCIQSQGVCCLSTPGLRQSEWSGEQPFCLHTHAARHYSLIPTQGVHSAVTQKCSGVYWLWQLAMTSLPRRRWQTQKRFDFQGNDKTLQSLEESWCVTDIMAACLLKIASLKAWLVMSCPASSHFQSIPLLYRENELHSASIVYVNYLFRSEGGTFVPAYSTKRGKTSFGHYNSYRTCHAECPLVK